MVHCQNCQAANTLDSKFCRSCGNALADDAIQAALAEHAKLVSEGERMAFDRRYEEAMAVAETAIAAHPASREALCLKASVHEHRGELGDAITTYERVVELYPDSALDKIKLNHLRNVLALQDPEENTRPQRRRALLAGAAATVLVVCIGATIGLIQGRNREESPKLVMEDPVGNQQANANPGFQMNPQAYGAQGNANQPQDTNANAGRLDVEGPGRVFDSGPRNTVIEGALTGGDRVPLINGVDPVVPPIRPVVQSRPQDPNDGGRPTEQVQGDGNTVKSGPDPAPQLGGSNTSQPTRATDGPGYINIRISDPNGPRIGGNSASGTGSSSQTSTGASALLITARNHHQTGDYAKAAQAYERALEAGAEPGRTNQNLAMVYQQLGRRNDALRAYQRAVGAYERQVAAGGDAARLGMAIETCKKAIEVLGG